MSKLLARTLVGLVVVTILVGALPMSALAAEDIPAPRQSGDTNPSDTIHVVQAGETLFRISVRYGVPMASIIAANNITNPARIYAGQQLVIPGSGSAPAPPASGETVQHVVQRGEILSRIAQSYGVPMASIIAANNITNPSRLLAGQVLTIPGATGTPQQPQPEQPQQPGSPAGSYVVQRGDTLFKIATRHGVSVNDLMAHNQISNPNRIFVGQRLIIPAAGSPPPASNAPAAPSASGKIILVVLSQQRTYAYENGQLLREFIVSTGLPRTPTVTGDYAVYVKYRAARMRGPGYDLANVPYVMYFYRGYGLHGTYWHNNFGQPMSHGCVNLRTSDAEWLFNWAPVGTPVRVVY